MRWSDYETEFVGLCYSHTSTKAIANHLGRSTSSVYQMGRKLGIDKHPSVNRNAAWANGQKTGLLHGFRKGQTPWNKGKHHSPPGSEKTWFRKGDMPKTWRPVGSTRRGRDGYLYRKVSDTRQKFKDWRLAHVLLWEQHNGPVPEGYIVVFKNRDHEDIRIDNLERITRAENMRRNQYQRYPENVAKAIQLRGALNRQINKRVRHEKTSCLIYATICSSASRR